MPLSTTVSLSFLVPFSSPLATERRICPSSVNLLALLRRLIHTCRMSEKSLADFCEIAVDFAKPRLDFDLEVVPVFLDEGLHTVGDVTNHRGKIDPFAVDRHFSRLDFG